MKNNGWIKLYRQLRNHDILKDSTALQIFIWLLIIVDRKTGKYTTGRFTASEELGIKPRTFHKALTERICKKYKLVTLTSDNKKTTILLNNWELYQSIGDSSSDNKVTTKGQQSDTKQEYKNIRIKEVLVKTNTDLESNKILIDLLIENFENFYKHKPIDKKPRYEAWNLLRKIKKAYQDIEREFEIESYKRHILSYFRWLTNQFGGESIETMSAVRRKYEIFYKKEVVNANKTN